MPDEETVDLIQELAQALALAGAHTKSERELLVKTEQWLEKYDV
jgi:hypothetical protein